MAASGRAARQIRGVPLTRVLVTGVNGFLGPFVCAALRSAGFDVVGAARGAGWAAPPGVYGAVITGNIDEHTMWGEALQGVEVAVHLAGRAHVVVEPAHDPLMAFRAVNTGGTLALARQAVAAGVRRLVFVSTIKVSGEVSPPGAPFTENDPAAPADPYAVSKYEAERGLRAIMKTSAMEVVIVRPPLVYGPGVKANFLRMMQWLWRGVPLPLRGVHNLRSLVAAENLADLIAHVARHPGAANQTFLASDGADLSTPGLLMRLGAMLGRPARLFPVPDWALESCAVVTGQSKAYRSLCGSLQADITKARAVLGWTPAVDVDTALAATARHFMINVALKRAARHKG